MIYLIKDEKRDGTLFKVGYATDIERRFSVGYWGHNAGMIPLEIIITYRKTKMRLETAIHKEIEAMGYEFITTPDGITREWFFVPLGEDAEFEHKGLAQFKACKGRKVIKL